MSRETQRISIPEPTNDPDALWRSVLILKEAVEVLQGIRGNRAAVTQNEYDEAIADIENRLVSEETKAFGAMHVKGNTSTTTLNSSGKVQVTVFDTNGPYQGCEPDHTNDHITVNRSGIYEVVINISAFNSAGAAHVISLDVFKNNGATGFDSLHANRSLNTGTDVGSISISGLIEVIDGDTLEFWANTDSGTNRDVTFQDISFSVFEVR